MFLLKYSLTEYNSLQTDISDKINRKIRKLITKPKALKILEQCKSKQLRKLNLYFREMFFILLSAVRVRSSFKDGQKSSVLFCSGSSALRIGLFQSKWKEKLSEHDPTMGLPNDCRLTNRLPFNFTPSTNEQ